MCLLLAVIVEVETHAYTTPKCGNRNFYCTETGNCLLRSERCTRDNDPAATGDELCKQKNYMKCDYDNRTRMFKVKKRSF